MLLGSYLSSITGVKVSVSLPDEDVEFLDAYASEQGFASRSAVLHKAVRLLRAVELQDDYQNAWEDWSASEDAGEWAGTASDGITS